MLYFCNHNNRRAYVFKYCRIDPVVQLVRMPPCHGGGRGFESRPDRKGFINFLKKLIR
ncbi:hypothetical protein E27107_410059 [Elizabethkingia anophelis]|nr:hypothetical protein E27107_410059 [Elizabethkingia anophelis]